MLPKGVRERANGVFQYNVMYKGKRVSGTESTQEKASQEREKALAQLVREYNEQSVGIIDINQKPKSATLQSMVSYTYATRWRGQKAERTHMINCELLMRFFTKDIYIKDITTQKVNDYVEYLIRNGAANSTINRKLSTLSAILKTAEDNDIETAQPKLRRRKEYKGRERFITKDEETVMLDTLERWDMVSHRDAVIVLIDTGMRCGELFKLQKNDIDFKAGKNGALRLWVTKNDRARSVPITTRVREVMQRRVENIKDTDFVFPFSYAWLRQGWNRLKTCLGYEDDPMFVLHILRHTCASRLVQSGVPLVEVQKWLGHTSIQTTIRYSHLAPSSLYQVVDVLEDYTKSEELVS